MLYKYTVHRKLYDIKIVIIWRQVLRWAGFNVKLLNLQRKLCALRNILS